ncbi:MULTISPECIES: helix-turn-helix domain-containing protein [Chryseobacterium]|uniref:AraC family transcriptional activator of pobA n=1 Tax=Chryseobacterium camelliae TaxID=1265445 RepID=A0ABU0TEI5_9FLAO|nr:MULTISPECIES: helix-turn-helix transcriptional regulator [Chryseobacterium]MDT3406828.1 AraC family transcriptional activator of pobA [Pseudacidovorax intermedius]MDQ1095376.1 AraC family transcriptional activator of pobA [Chryseobacterium camelliae]MDQ1099314.1 AraC family transcriptional activator of pobA [Chryseobacterium sp. SORGH_AS_1048]MDR6086663.1 AraC family transcriptional activator of pobA [Chryseobacterium sp. SORGH_AS_0909]MDR6131035.1 AraC family transcriptional activator of p
MSNQNFRVIKSVEDYHKLLKLNKPQHPLLSIIDFSAASYINPAADISIVMDLYCISIKENSDCILRYGPKHYDFTEGVMSFIKPGQVLTVEPGSSQVTDGFSLVFHPDFIRSFPLYSKLKNYAFFDYEVNEALFLSEMEKIHIRGLMASIMQEYTNSIDLFSQEAIVAFIELLLVYGNRYYNRQFITRKSNNEHYVVKFEKMLESYFSSGKLMEDGLPNVKYFAEQLHMSPNYLSDLLRLSTGKSAQGHIQELLIEEAKTLLTTSHLSVAEISYMLGFEQPQSLNRLFKKKTNMSPVQFRQSFN